MKKLIRVTLRPDNRISILLDVDKIEMVMQETVLREKRTSTIIFYNGKRVMVEESYDCVMERIKKADEEAKIS